MKMISRFGQAYLAAIRMCTHSWKREDLKCVTVSGEGELLSDGPVSSDDSMSLYAYRMQGYSYDVNTHLMRFIMTCTRVCIIIIKSFPCYQCVWLLWPLGDKLYNLFIILNNF